MPRSIWSGVISFGVVSIPVKLYTATESKDVSFHLLHKECQQPPQTAALVSSLRARGRVGRDGSGL